MFHRLINNLLSILEHSMVMLSPHAFVKPYEYLYRNETHAEVVAYSRYLNDETEFQANENLKLKVCYLFDHLSFSFLFFTWTKSSWELFWSTLIHCISIVFPFITALPEPKSPKNHFLYKSSLVLTIKMTIFQMGS